MNKEDRGRLVAFGYVVALAVTLVVFIFFSRYINPIYLIAILWGYQQFFVIPELSKNYKELYDQEDNWKRFIPIWNEYAIFPPAMAYSSLGFGLAWVILAIVGMSPTIFGGAVPIAIEGIAGEVVAKNFSFYCLLFAVVLFVVALPFRALGYIEIKRSIDREYFKYFPTNIFKAFEKTHYIFLFIPLLRVFSLLAMNESLKKLVVYNSVLEDDDNFKEI